VQAQTVDCAIETLVDYGGRGAGWARNRLLERVSTPFVVFLDADDYIEPNFVERCLAVWQPGRYVYTDW
jgi:glycosyltransferase involved in cell wall biosynthesis